MLAYDQAQFLRVRQPRKIGRNGRPGRPVPTRVARTLVCSVGTLATFLVSAARDVPGKDRPLRFSTR